MPTGVRATNDGVRANGVGPQQVWIRADPAQLQRATHGKEPVRGDIRFQKRTGGQPARRRAAGATPLPRRLRRRPMEVSSAEETTAGSPACATISRALRTPPRGWALMTIRSAAPARATANGSSSLRTDFRGNQHAKSRARTSSRTW